SPWEVAACFCALGVPPAACGDLSEPSGVPRRKSPGDFEHSECSRRQAASFLEPLGVPSWGLWHFRSALRVPWTEIAESRGALGVFSRRSRSLGEHSSCPRRTVPPLRPAL